MQNVTQAPSFALHPHDLGKLIPEFSEGDGVMKWLRRIDHYCILYGWTEQMCLLYGSTRLNGAAGNWYKRQEERIFSWAQFKEQLVAAFPETFDEADIHRQLEAVKIEKCESYESFVYRVDALAQKGDFSTSATLKYIIKGLRYDQVYPSLLAMQYKSTLDLLRHIKWVASNLNMLPQASSRMVRSEVRTTTDSRTDTSGSSLTCFNCRETGHKSIDCLKPQRRERCGKCSKVGHSSERCMSMNSQKVSRAGERSSTNVMFQSDAVDSISVDHASQAEVELDVSERRIRAMALVDSGSYASLIKSNLLPSRMSLKKAREEIVAVNNSKVEVLGEWVGCLYLKKRKCHVRFLVVSECTMQVELILGRSFLKENRIQSIKFPLDFPQISLDIDVTEDVTSVSTEWAMFGDVESVCALNNYTDGLDVGDDGKTWSYREQLGELLRVNYFERPRTGAPLVKYEAEIRLKCDKLFTSTPQRLSVFERNELDKIVANLLEQGIIRESDSPYTSRVVLTKKKNNSYRMCVNYKPLNRIVERNHFPMPVIDDQIMKLQGKRYFTCLDLKNGFYHVELTEESKKYTSFVTNSGQYEFNRLPFGYANSPAVFVKFINKVLDPFIRDGRIVVFIDDMLIASVDIQEHLRTLKDVLQVLADNHLELQFSKCQFIKTRIEYLGYDVKFNSIQPSDRHIQSVRDFPIPTDRKNLQRFLGFVNYFRKFVEGFNMKAGKLYELLKEERNFILTAEHLEAVEELKQALISKPVLRIYSPNSETELHTDASSAGF